MKTGEDIIYTSSMRSRVDSVGCTELIDEIRLRNIKKYYTTINHYFTIWQSECKPT
jgi:hypothetical protein